MQSMIRSGIIPTRMGTSHLVSSVGVYNWDHPHAYGDKGIFRRHRRYCLGSSPRVWGQEVQAGTNSLHLRIIPTRMGTRAPAGQIYGSMRDHPHAYGDKLKKQTTANQCTGSSPRVWGQVYRDKVAALNIRIIPTRMGTSACYSL